MFDANDYTIDIDDNNITMGPYDSKSVYGTLKKNGVGVYGQILPLKSPGSLELVIDNSESIYSDQDGKFCINLDSTWFPNNNPTHHSPDIAKSFTIRCYCGEEPKKILNEIFVRVNPSR